MTEKFNPVTGQLLANPIMGKRYYFVCIKNNEKKYSVKVLPYSEKKENLLFRGKIFKDKIKAEKFCAKINKNHTRACMRGMAVYNLVNKIKFLWKK